MKDALRYDMSGGRTVPVMGNVNTEETLEKRIFSICEITFFV